MIKKNTENEKEFTINARSMSFFIISFSVIFFLSFIAGYYLGKKSAAEDFLYKAEQDSFADQIYSSMCVLYDTKEDADDTQENAEEVDTADTESVEQKIIAEEPLQSAATPLKVYEVTLAGFSASRKIHAQAMVDRLKKKGYTASLVEVTSTSSSGKKIPWYQVKAEIQVPENSLSAIKHEISIVAQVNEKSISLHERALH